MYRNCDKGIIKEYLRDAGTLAEEDIVLKLMTGITPADPTKGIAAVLQFTLVRYKGVITGITQQDSVTSGGIYQLGDISVQLRRELKAINDITGDWGDRVIWLGHEYRQVGRISTNYAEGYILYDYAFRRI